MTALLFAALLTDDRSLAELEQDAFQKAALSAAESVVRIETIGGLDKVGDVLLNTGATTGTVVGRDGYILSSAFNFVGEPSAIFVTLPDGRRVQAERVATDTLRKLVLLKADAEDLTPIEAAGGGATVGRWAIAVGRTYEGGTPNVSVGVVSAVGRVWGLAIQTDAKVSPVNYGGPLLNVEGRAVGVLVPLASDNAGGEDALSGIEWYDSGIGFAIPIADAIESAKRLRDGEDLKRGRIGVGFEGPGLLDEAAVVKRVHPLGPADEAGIEAGDEIVAANGVSVNRRGDLTAVLTRMYAGDAVRLKVRRGEDVREVDVQSVAELPAYDVPGLGLLVDVGADGRPFVRVSDVTGIEPGDVIVKVGEEPIAAAGDIAGAVSESLAGTVVPVTVERGGEETAVDITTVKLSTDLPDDLPRRDFGEADVPDGATVGRFTGEVLEGQVEYSAYAPTAAAAGNPAALLVWLGDGGQRVMGLGPQLGRRNVALLVPSPKGENWSPADKEAVIAAIDAVAAEVPVDRRRVAVFADGPTAVLGLALLESEPAAASGLILRKPRLRRPPASAEPGKRRFFALVEAEDDRMTGLITAAMEKSRQLLTAIPDPDEDPEALLRWVDWMGRE